MFSYSPVFKTHVNLFACIISNNCRFHSAVHHTGFAKTGFGSSVWMSYITFFECVIRFVFYHSPVFKTDINVICIFISNNSSLHSTVHHSNFTKTRGFNIWIGNTTFFKFLISSAFGNCPIFKTNINICILPISNDSSFHSTVHHTGFAKAGFGSSTWMSYSTFFKFAILFMFHHSSVFKTDIYISGIPISNNCGFHTAIHHSGFTKSICFCCHKLSLAFLQYSSCRRVCASLLLQMGKSIFADYAFAAI